MALPDTTTPADGAAGEAAPSLLDTFLALDASDPAACEAFRWHTCPACQQHPPGAEGDAHCKAARCGLRDDWALAGEQADIRYYRAGLAVPELAPEDLLASFRSFIREAGCATFSLLRDERGWLSAGFASGHLRDRLHSALVQEVLDTAGIPLIPGTWAQWSVKQFEQYVGVMRKRLKARHHWYAHYFARRGMPAIRIARLLGRDRGTVARWLKKPPG